MSLSPSNSSFREAIAPKILDQDHLLAHVERWRAAQRTIATINGSFDLMHAGHLEILYQASLQADVLIVALNTDSSIQRYKNPLRPIIPLESRMQMMAALEMVDVVTWFDETDPRHLLSLIRPDVHVNGSEYGKQCLEAEVVREGGGRIHIVPLCPGLSTSQIIKKIVNTCA